MNEARSNFGGAALPVYFFMIAFTMPLHCELVTQRDVSSVGWNKYGVSLPAAAYSKSVRYRDSGSFRSWDMLETLGPSVQGGEG